MTRTPSKEESREMLKWLNRNRHQLKPYFYISSNTIRPTQTGWRSRSMAVVLTNVSPQSDNGHSFPVNDIAITPDGQTVASGSDDRMVKLWDIDSGRELQSLTGHDKSIFAIAISPNGQYLASGSNDNTIKIWRLSL